MFGSTLKYMQAEELAEKVANGAVAAGQVVVMDVRGRDEFESGHIKGATHLPSTNWSDPAFVDKVVEQYAADDSAGKRSIVVHCAYSQQRGPACARALLNRLAELGRDPTAVPDV